ncbi:TPA: hypothetical protein HIS87_004600 [Escherichia coli]|uniref:hypothetical protein n=1 Tax=Escherichia coli TaxID=562 RepID=UPI0012E92BB4|nr:hypothetical protein [Escherichia coli]HAI0977641.1 hypothetical protein [Escherichia coli]
MHKSENEKIDFILDEHEQIFRKQGSLCMALGKGFLVIAILCGVVDWPPESPDNQYHLFK